LLRGATMMTMMRSGQVQPERFAALKSALEERRQAVGEEIERARRATLADGEVGDFEDQGATESLRTTTLELAELDRVRLAALDDALRRLECGRYGVCGECNGDIARDRLIALPFAVRCQSCQAAREKAERLAGATADLRSGGKVGW